MTDTIRTRDERRQERSYQQLGLSHLSYVIQWRYDKAREIAGQIECYTWMVQQTTFAEPPELAFRQRQTNSRRQTAANEEVGEQQSSSRNRRPVQKPNLSNPWLRCTALR